MHAGINTWTSHGPVALSIHQLVIDPVTPSRLYAVNHDGPGGVFRSTDAGGSWSAANAGLTNEFVFELAIDPVTPTTLYAATGSSVFKSTDAGDTWTAVDMGLPDLFGIVALAIDPITPSTLYAWTAGVVKSTDAGGTWSVAANTGLPPISGVAALVVDPITPSTLYAVGGGAGVSKSTDAGASWVCLGCDGTPDMPGLFDYGVSALAIDPIAPSTLYAATLFPKTVFKSTDAGDTWNAAEGGLTDASVSALAIDPVTPSTLYAATDGGVFRSIDAGRTWSAINAGLTNTSVHTLAIDPATTSTLYAGTDSGVFRSTDAGRTWIVADTGLPGRNVSQLVIDPTTPSTLYVRTLDTGFTGFFGKDVLKSTDAGRTWSAADVGLPITTNIALAIDPITPTTLYAGTGGGLYKSTDAGGTWSAFSDAFPGAFAVGLTIDPITPGTFYADVIFAGCGRYCFAHSDVYKSTDAGATWAPFAPSAVLLAIDPVTPSTVYALLSDGLSKSTDAGETWTAANKGLPGGGSTVSVLAIDPLTPTTLYAVTGEGVFKSTDGGMNWGVTGLTAASPITALAIDPVTPRILYAGTLGGGVFKSTDGGANWSPFNPGLTTTNVRALAIDPLTPTTVYAGTYTGVFDIEQVPVRCVGDCNNDQAVGIDELLTLVNIELGNPGSCQTGVPVGATVDVSLIVQAVNNALNGCAGAPSTATPTSTGTLAATRTSSTPMATGTSMPGGPTPTPTRAATIITGTPPPTTTQTPLRGNFVDNGDGTITDTRTGLIWEKKDQSGGLHDMNAQYVWAGGCADNATPTVPPGLSKNHHPADAVLALLLMTSSVSAQARAADSGPCQPDAAAATACSAATGSAVLCAQCVGSQTCGDARGFTTIWEWLEQLNSAHFAGHSDWRIPTAEELKTIIDGSVPGCISGAPCLPPVFDTACTSGCSVTSCSCAQAWFYWSATTEAGYPWAVGFELGTWTFDSGSDGIYVRAVRGTTIPTPTATSTPMPLLNNFVDNGDGTITDTQRGLMWEKKDASGGLHDENTLYAWACLTPDAEFFCQPDAAAAATCSAATGGADGCGQCPRGVPCNPEGFTTIWEWLNQLNAAHFAGYSDWRIPTVGDEGGAAELETIVDAGAPRCASRAASAACVPAQFDTACTPGCSVASCSCANGDQWWSSISVPASPWAWEVEFNSGLPLYADNKDGNRFVRAVRGAPSSMATATPIPTPIPGNFVDNGDGTITDTQRGLTWEKKDVSYNDSGSPSGGSGSHDEKARYRWAGLCNDNSGYCQPDAAAAATCAAATGGAVGCAQCGGLGICNLNGGYTIWQWLNQLNAASFAGHSDWRLPTVSELETIVDASGPACGSGTPCVPPAFGSGGCEGECTATSGCSCTQAGLSWSATSFASHSTSAWLVNFGTGGTDFLDKTLNYYVRAVRAGS